MYVFPLSSKKAERKGFYAVVREPWALQSRGCGSLVRASDCHAADAGSILRCGKGFFSQGQLSVRTLLQVSVHPPCAITCIDICAHVKDPVVHVRV